MATAAFSSVLLPLMSMNKMCFSSSSNNNNNNNATSMISFSVKNLSGSCRVSMSVSDHGSHDTTPINEDSLMAYECNPFTPNVVTDILWGTYPCFDKIENLSPVARRCVDALKDIQDQGDKIQDEHDKESDVLEAKYQKLYQPLYAKRFEIVNGITEVPLAPDEIDQVKGVPSFWMTALKNNYITGQEITESDKEALKYLNDIKWCNIKYQFQFFFDLNPYFKNTLLTKSCLSVDGEDKIDWYPGKCLTQKNNKSFFNFFNPPQGRAYYFNIEGEIEHEIIPRAFLWYAMEVEDEEEEEEEEVDEEEDGEEG